MVRLSNWWALGPIETITHWKIIITSEIGPIQRSHPSRITLSVKRLLHQRPAGWPNGLRSRGNATAPFRMAFGAEPSTGRRRRETRTFSVRAANLASIARACDDRHRVEARR